MDNRIDHAFLRGRHLTALALVGGAFLLTGLLGLHEAHVFKGIAADHTATKRVHAHVGEALAGLTARTEMPAADRVRLRDIALEMVDFAETALPRIVSLAEQRCGRRPAECENAVSPSASLESNFSAFFALARDVAAAPPDRADPRLGMLLSLAQNAVLPQLRSIADVQQQRDEDGWGHLVRMALGSGVVLAATLAIAGLLVFRPMERRILETQEALRRETTRARDAEISKGAFLANMSHEIRTALNGVIGVSELLAGTKLDTEQADLVAIQRASGESLLRIINDVLDFSKVGAGEMSVEVGRFEPRRALVDTTRLFAPMAASKGLTLDLEIDPETPRWAMGDGVRLRQIIANILQNALKFTAAGRIDVTANWRAISRTLIISVRDTGVGIPPDRLATVFQAFQQVDNDLTPKHHGTGLGLTLARMFAEKMGGGVTVESAVGVGTAFHVSVQLGATLDPVATPTLAGRRVLLAMGPGPRADAMSRTLSAAGATVARKAVPALDAVVFDAAPAIADPDDSRPLADSEAAAASAVALWRGIAPRARLLALHTTGVAAPAVDAALATPVDPDALLDAVAGRTAAAPTAAGPMRRLRVLLADDNPVNQMIAQRMLELMGCTVHVVADGAAALEATIAGRPDLVLMDVSMPVMTGLQATGEIRRREAAAGRRTPIVALTAHATAEHRERCAEAGMDDHLPKPFRPADLAEVLARWSPAEGAADPAAGRAVSL